LKSLEKSGWDFPERPVCHHFATRSLRAAALCAPTKPKREDALAALARRDVASPLRPKAECDLVRRFVGVPPVLVRSEGGGGFSNRLRPKSDRRSSLACTARQVRPLRRQLVPAVPSSSAHEESAPASNRYCFRTRSSCRSRHHLRLALG